MPSYQNCGAYVQEEPLALVVEKKRPRDEPPPPLYRIRGRSPAADDLHDSAKMMCADERAQDLSVDLRPQEVVRIATVADEKRDLIPKSTLVSQEESSRNG